MIRFLELVMVRDVDQRNRLVVLPVITDMEGIVVHQVEAFRRFILAENPIADCEAGDFKLALFVADGVGGDRSALRVDERERNACQRVSCRIDLLEGQLHALVGNDGNRLSRIDERAVKGQCHLRAAGQVARKRLAFNDSIASIRDFFKHGDTVCIGQHCSDDCAALIFQRERHARQRFFMFADLFQHEAREIVAQNGIPRNLPVLIYGKGAGRFIQRVPFGRKHLFEGVAPRRNGNIEDYAVFIGNGAVNDFSLLILDLDLCARNGFRAGDIGFGQRDFGVNQLVTHRSIQ